ncbi:MAG TPA: hypothetical protein VME40_00030 [Caulobacteraceae bacterium]|nr:hypothetical protein [Caulobacteraceae bacterium]
MAGIFEIEEDAADGYGVSENPHRGSLIACPGRIIRKLGRKDPHPLDDRPQVDQFRDLARQLETDDDEARFNERLKKLAKAKAGVPANTKGPAKKGGW